jgi:hypothetical protein
MVKCTPPYTAPEPIERWWHNPDDYFEISPRAVDNLFGYTLYRFGDVMKVPGLPAVVEIVNEFIYPDIEYDYVK